MGAGGKKEMLNIRDRWIARDHLRRRCGGLSFCFGVLQRAGLEFLAASLSSDACGQSFPRNRVLCSCLVSCPYLCDRVTAQPAQVFPLKLQRHHVPVPAERPTLAGALLRRWTAGGSCLCQHRDRRVSAGVLPNALNLTAYSEWSQVPPEERADVQPLCMHPRTLAEAVIQLHANKSKCVLPSAHPTPRCPAARCACPCDPRLHSARGSVLRHSRCHWCFFSGRTGAI